MFLINRMTRAAVLAGVLLALATPAGARPPTVPPTHPDFAQQLANDVAQDWADSVAACRAQVQRTPGTGQFDAYIPVADRTLVHHMGTRWATFLFYKCLNDRGHQVTPQPLSAEERR